MLDLNNKKVLMPFVVVYKNALSNHIEILNAIKKTEDYLPEGGIMEPWKQWYDFGNTVRLGTFGSLKDSFKTEHSEEYKSQLNIFNSLNSIIIEGYDDYIADWSTSNLINSSAAIHPHDWQKVFGDIVSDWNYKNIKTFNEDFDQGTDVMSVDGDSGWIESSIDIAKHHANTNKEFAINYHLDASGDMNPGPKAILTSTVYLNDDYKGGEISFLNEFDNVIINYKPSAGDLIIFPSAKPFFHAALPTSGDINKYFARHFLTYKYVGSKEWHDGIKEYGEKVWLKIHSEIRKAEDAMGFYTKDVYFPGQNNKAGRQHGTPFFAKEVINIGRD